jgi:hypothetical protein
MEQQLLILLTLKLDGMKIKLQDYCLVSNDFIKALNDYGIPKHFIETIPAEKLAEHAWNDGYFEGGDYLSDECTKKSKQDFLNSEIEIK